GAIRQYVDGQERASGADDLSIFCIVDLHAITVAYDPAELRERTYDTTALLIAAGLDPERCILYRQSDVPEQTELCWLLASVTAHGDLNRMHQFKEKSDAQRELVSAGLFFYPVLQAADVLAFRCDEVPVGEDQRQHIELMRDIAERFNARFADGEELLTVPEHSIPQVGARIMDLQDPTSKMSTTSASEEGTVYVLDQPEQIKRKFARAVTDSDDPPRIAFDPSKPGVSNLLDILGACKGITPEEAAAELADARGYGDLKGAVSEAVTELLAPVRERYEQIRGDEAQLEAILARGAQRAREIAEVTVGEAKAAMGVGPTG
ncbi:MAG: tryptophan--tRNA ligase, partial [Actinobacteria bacterium]|nr:tryptophan--tRNA ligase [Actinomycetota bacterium]